MKGKVVMITGATGGIGKETARGLAHMGATLVLVSRSKEKLIRIVDEMRSETENKDIDYLPCDLTSMESVRRLASEYREKYDRLDVLINNAGEIINERRISVDGYEYTLALDHLSHFLLTSLLLDIIIRSAPSRIINLSSVGHIMGHIDFDDIMIEKGYTPGKAYGQAKLANILFTYELARRLSDTGVTVNCLHPGMVRTNFGKDTTGAWKLFILLSKPFMISARKGAQTSIYLASSPEVVSVSGKYFAKKKVKKSSKESYDESVAKRLWRISEELTGTGSINQE